MNRKKSSSSDLTCKNEAYRFDRFQHDLSSFGDPSFRVDRHSLQLGFEQACAAHKDIEQRTEDFELGLKFRGCLIIHSASSRSWGPGHRRLD